jgi:anti-sigma factor RsiW
VNPSDHPTIDQIADLQEGILPASEAADVRAHVDDCPECRETLAALTGVSSLLAAEGSESVQIPADVAERIHDALDAAAVERAAGVPSLAEHRESQERTRKRRTGRWVFGAAAAAAAVVVFGGAVGILGDRDGESPSAGDTAVDAGGQAAESAPDPTEETFFLDSGEGSALRVDRDELRTAAEALASGSVTEKAPVGRCMRVALANASTEDVVASQFGPSARAIVLLVDERQGTYRLVDCLTGRVITKGTF